MAELKQGRWVKVHEPGQANYVESENVMDIVIGTGRCQAEATYTVRSYKKAAYWLEEYLKAAEAMQIVAADILEQIKAAADSANREDDEVSASGEGWSSVIEKMGFETYFLIVWDFINYARSVNVYIGPGRGSAAGSLLAFCMGITDMDPIRFNLLFERFLNPERVSWPD